jgi:hypothetical protein
MATTIQRQPAPAGGEDDGDGSDKDGTDDVDPAPAG